MSHSPYPYNQIRSRQYTFFSIGKMKIEKVVDFVSLGENNIINLGFGDLRPDGTVDDKVNSNNGDIVKVMATVVEILKHFTTNNPEAIIFFRGSTEERNQLYARILKTYYPTFSKDFILLAMIGNKEDNEVILFDPTMNIKYFAFLIKKIV